MNAYAVIMAGGSGERLWPLSTPELPKQFVSLFGGKPLIRHAVDRLNGLIPAERIFVITAGRLVAMTRKALPSVPAGNIIGEPCRRDTAAAVAVCRAIEAVAGFTPGIKWVNDILMHGKKLCGILVEAGFTGGGTFDYAVLGIGINLRFDPAAHPALAEIAGGLTDFSDRVFGHAELAAALLQELDRVYALLCAGDTAAILNEYRTHLLGMGETITVHGTDGPWQATCTGLDAQGHLLVRDDRGEHVLSSGEISIRLAEQKNMPAKEFDQ